MTMRPDMSGNLEALPMWAGQSVGLVREPRPAGDIIREIEADAVAILRRLGA